MYYISNERSSVTDPNYLAYHLPSRAVRRDYPMFAGTCDGGDGLESVTNSRYLLLDHDATFIAQHWH